MIQNKDDNQAMAILRRLAVEYNHYLSDDIDEDDKINLSDLIERSKDDVSLEHCRLDGWLNYEGTDGFDPWPAYADCFKFADGSELAVTRVPDKDCHEEAGPEHLLSEALCASNFDDGWDRGVWDCASGERGDALDQAKELESLGLDMKLTFLGGYAAGWKAQEEEESCSE